jgi:hypothetical protein
VKGKGLRGRRTETDGEFVVLVEDLSAFRIDLLTGLEDSY